MEYSFGTERSGGLTYEVVKVKSDYPVDLIGRYTVERQNDVETVTDTFTVVRRIRAKRANDTFYTWYEITGHNRYVDRFEAGIKKTEQEITDHELALIEAEQTITDLDLRLMELEMK